MIKSTEDLVHEYLEDSKTRKIGIYGFGGAGETFSIEEDKHWKDNEGFKFKIKVTIGREFDAVRVQKEIAKQLMLDISECDDPMLRAGLIYTALEGEKYILFLDDVWEAFSLEDVGIPEPDEGNNSKLVLTTCTLEACQSMGCKIVKEEPLPREKALEQFHKEFGRDIPCATEEEMNLKPMIEQCVEDCGGFPLAIVKVARFMKQKHENDRWKDLHNELTGEFFLSQFIEGEIKDKLKFGFSSLKNHRVLKCLLYCSYYPKDYIILKEELIEHWIDAGLMDDMETMQARYDRGHAAINILESRCFIQSVNNGDSVKMHNLVRLMALGEEFVKDRVLVKAGMQLKALPDEEEWMRSFEKVSLIKNSISEISSDIWPNCEMLTILLLKMNPLNKIGDLFFKHMPKLGILDLSYTNIVKLPESISDLSNLTALILKRCWQLKHVPSLANLKALRKLDLSYTSIREIPKGLELLFNLISLNLYTSTLESLPLGILPNLSHLQHLVLDWTSERSFIRVDELQTLKRLETFVGRLCGLHDLNKYIYFLRKGKPDKYMLQVGHGSVLLPPITVHKVSKEVRLSNTSIKDGRGLPVLALLPWDLHGLRLEECRDLKSLCDVHSLKAVHELKTCELVKCDEIECLLTCSSSISLCGCSSLLYVEVLSLSCLRDFNAIHNGVSGELQCLPFGTFQRLRKFTIYHCPGIKKLLMLGMVSRFSNLEELHIKRCKQLEEIVAAQFTDEEPAKEKPKELNQCHFPKLRSLKLWGLPELKSICNGTMVCNSLMYLQVFDCPKLKEIPLSLPSMDDAGYGPHPSLRTIFTSKDWWDSLEWDYQDAKHMLEPHCDFSCF